MSRNQTGDLGFDIDVLLLPTINDKHQIVTDTNVNDGTFFRQLKTSCTVAQNYARLTARHITLPSSLNIHALNTRKETKKR